MAPALQSPISAQSRTPPGLRQRVSRSGASEGPSDRREAFVSRAGQHAVCRTRRRCAGASALARTNGASMTAFELSDDTWQRVDYRLLQNGPCVLFWRLETLMSHVARLRNLGYHVAELDARAWSDSRALHEQLAL